MVRAAWLASALAATLLPPLTHAVTAPLRGSAVNDAGNNSLPLRQAVALYAGEGDQDCELSDWVNGACDARTLTLQRTRVVVAEPKGNGLPCDAPLSEVVACKPVNCRVGPWSEWSDCGENGRKTRTRDVLVEPSAGGRACSHTVDTVKCRAEDCRVCAWIDVGCDEATGMKRRERRVMRHPQDGGRPCPALWEDYAVCGPADCELSDEYEDEWGDCDAHGDKYKRHKVKTLAKFGGAACVDPKETWLKSAGACPPRDCSYTTSALSDCTKTSSGWFRQRTQVVTATAQYGGTCAVGDGTVGTSTVSEAIECPAVDCAFTTSALSDCVPTAGGWLQQQTQVVTALAEYDGTCDIGNGTVGASKVVVAIECEAVDCAFTTSGWSDCVPTSDGWARQKTDTVTAVAQYGGACGIGDGSVGATRVSASDLCPKADCTSTTSDWSDCVLAEDGWFRQKTETVTAAAQYGGACDIGDGSVGATRVAASDPCAAVDCTFSTSELSDCVSTPVGWFQERKQVVISVVQYGGGCDVSDGTVGASAVSESIRCLAEDCAFTTSDWSNCVETSDGWARQKTDKVTAAAQYGGACSVAGGKVGDSAVSATEVCPAQDCKTTESEWCACELASYNTYTKSKKRTVTEGAKYGGKCIVPSGRQGDSIVSATLACEPVNCVARESAWGPCKNVSGSYVQTQTLTVKTAPKYGGTCAVHPSIVGSTGTTTQRCSP